MKKFFLSICALFATISCFTFAEHTILSPVASVQNGEVVVTWINGSAGGNVDVTIQNPSTNELTHLSSVDIAESYFSFPLRREGEHKIILSPDNGGETEYLSVNAGTKQETTTQNTQTENNKTQQTENTTIRNVIPATPKTGPGENIIGLIIASLVIFGGYIFIKKQASL